MYRWTFFVIILFSLTGTVSPFANDSPSFRIMSFNILRTDSDQENLWGERKVVLFDEIREIAPDLFGIQEPTAFQMDEFCRFFPEYNYVGLARDDGKRGGEFSPVFYKKECFELLKCETFWLSETPEIVGSRGWDAQCNRVVTWAKLRHIESGQIIIFANTHLDHIGETARANGAKLILQRLTPLTESGQIPLFITGDFNCHRESVPYQIITSGYDQFSGLTDVALVAEKKTLPVHRTWNDFGNVPKDDSLYYIDYIFMNNRAEVKNFVVTSDTRGEIYPSDHNAIYVDLILCD